MIREKCLIIGVTSLVGARLAESLRADAQGFEPVFTTRRPKQADEIRFDLTDPESFEVEGFSHVIATTPIWLMTDEVLTRLWGQGMTRLVVFSSTSRFSKTFSPEPDERRIADLLAASEARISAFGAVYNVAVTILRPTLIYDEGRDQNISRIAKFIEKFGFFIVCGKGAGLRQPVHARDLATAALQALRSDAARDKAYDLSGGETLTYSDMVARIFEAKGNRPRIISLPAWLWRLGFGGLGLIRPGQSLKSNVNMALRMNDDLVFDHSPARTDFSYNPQPFKPSFIRPNP
ncbi:NAD-dependent epimerase/dehydratase family protein [Asticcacaulis sp. ZE23SCel15]|uniref:NAD-dependent epimerase/dehydratase family protein n=1 Tax=Asticcacaulis sp. ZE23SCel15 TaxID=3059027 RepID=UPI00265EF85A|nr:NAD-dependent epimerase/dehydratase family protein [Asticcacaulis sp. ZE23SCel15]WKL56992.1 NAD-dependent epimerase/dehydratase family protein [Asticcacaulis sp. ZE23SCel15]